MPAKVPQNVEYLRENGPTPLSELPGEFTISDRRHGAARLKIEGGRRFPPDSVAYLLDEHDPKAIVQTFIDTNPGYVESVSRPTLIPLFGNHGQEFKDAAKELLDSYDWSEHWSSPTDEQTPPADGGPDSRLSRLLGWVISSARTGGER